jgi:hypothetical protein
LQEEKEKISNFPWRPFLATERGHSGPAAFTLFAGTGQYPGIAKNHRYCFMFRSLGLFGLPRIHDETRGGMKERAEFL